MNESSLALIETPERAAARAAAAQEFGSEILDMLPSSPEEKQDIKNHIAFAGNSPLKNERENEFSLTALGGQISDHQRKLDQIIETINSEVIPDAALTRVDDPKSIAKRWSDYLVRNDINEHFVNFTRLDTNKSLAHAKEAEGNLEMFKRKLELLAYTLTQRKDIKIGESFTLHRLPTEEEPKPQPEPGWKVYQITAAGNLRLLKPDEGSGSFVDVPQENIPYDKIDSMLPKQAEPEVDDDGYYDSLVVGK
jgi:hypothetical protein